MLIFPLNTLWKETLETLEGNFKKLYIINLRNKFFFTQSKVTYLLNVSVFKGLLQSLTHCVKSVRIRSYSGPHYPTFRLNTERYEVSLRINSECGKIRTRITPNTDTFCAVYYIVLNIFQGEARESQAGFMTIKNKSSSILITTTWSQKAQKKNKHF